MAKKSYNVRASIPSSNKEGMPMGITKPTTNYELTEDVKKTLSMVSPIFEELLKELKVLNTNISEPENNRVNRINKINNEKRERSSLFNDNKKNSFESKSIKIFDKLIKGSVDVVKKNNDSLRGAFLGPINLLMKPIEDFTGKTFALSSLLDGSATLFKKVFFKKPIMKKHPSESDLVKNKELGPLFLVDFFKKHLDKNKKTDSLLPSISPQIKTEGIFKSLTKGFSSFGSMIGGALLAGGKKIASLASMVAKFASPVAIITAIVMAVIDGIKAIFKSKDWGASKISSFFAGFFSSTSSGWKGAFSGMGKWALLGVGIGLPFAPPIGPIVGGILGAVIGGILGFIGGQKIAVAFDKMGSWFKEIAFPAIGNFFVNIGNGIKNFFVSMWNGIKGFFSSLKEKLLSYFKGFSDIWNSDKSIGRKLGETVRYAIIGIIKFITYPFVKLGELLVKGGKAVVGFFKKINFKEIFLNMWEAIKKPFIKGGIFIKDLTKSIFGFFKKINFGEIFSNIWNTLKKPFVKGGIFVKNIFKSLKKWIKKLDFKDFFMGIWEKIKGFPSIIGNGIKKIISRLSEIFSWTNIKTVLGNTGEFLLNIGNKIMTFIYDFFAGLFNVDTTWEEFKGGVSDIINKFLINPLKSAFGAIMDAFTLIGDTFGFIGSQGWSFFSSLIDGSLGTKFEEYRRSLGRYDYKEETVDDAIIRKDGSIVRTSPDDNIIATKNNPLDISEIKSFTINKLKDVEGKGYGGYLEYKLDKMIDILSKILEKDLIIQNPPQTKQDLIKIIEGVI